jgi:outer membrane protein OmpA-like peptidoglycan-associated protein
MTVNTGKKAAKVNQGADSADDVGRLSQQKLDTSLRNLNGYKLIATEAVYFDLNRSLLTKEDCEKLDETLGKLAHLKVYVLEVEARADHPGDQAYNRELCRRRAQAVVNYLTVEHGVPLRAIRQLGVGKDSPDTENTMSVDREQVGRVDVKIYALNIT